MTQQDVINAAAYVVHHWHEIAAYSVGGLSIAVILQWMKRRFKIDEINSFKIVKLIRMDGPRIVVIILTLFTAIGTAVNWLIDPANARFIPEKYLFLLSAAFYIHRFMVSPIALKIETVLKPYLLAIAQMKQQGQTVTSPTLVSPNNTVSPPPVTPVPKPFTVDPPVPPAQK